MSCTKEDFIAGLPENDKSSEGLELSTVDSITLKKSDKTLSDIDKNDTIKPVKLEKSKKSNGLGFLGRLFAILQNISDFFSSFTFFGFMFIGAKNLNK